MSSETLIVAIDGPSGVGKSTVAGAVAERLELPYLETGAMYRALGWRVYRDQVRPEDRVQVERVAADLDLDLRRCEDGTVEILLDGRKLDAGVRRPEVSEITSLISSYPVVRRRMVEIQRRFARSRGVVMEGRDIGTAVFPGTPYKFFLTAPLDVRVERRLRQLAEAGEENLSAEAIRAEVEERDTRDRLRQESPLTMDESYTVVDTGQLTAAQAVDLIVDSVEESSRSPADHC